MKVPKKYIFLILLILAFGGLMKFIVVYQRANWDQITAKIVRQNEYTDYKSASKKEKTKGIVCDYILKFVHNNKARSEKKKVNTSCNKTHTGYVVLLINPKDPSYYNLDFGLKPKEQRNK